MSELIPLVPNCIVTVLFDREHATFSYTCSHRSRGWQVLPSGNIIPPSPLRVVQFRVKTWPPENSSAFGKVPSFAGFQVASADKKLPPKTKRWPPLPPGVSAVVSPLPVGAKATSPLVTVDFGTGRWAYRLAVTGADGEPAWDDPKIHDYGSDW